MTQFLCKLVLIGGGHSHAIALKLWGMNPLSQVELTLITDVIFTPYSGMLPGHVAGFYSYEETHINLHSLTQFASAQLCLDKAIGLDLKNQQVICQNHPPISYDYLSLDMGSTPNILSVTGAADYTIPAKPVPLFLQAWQQIITQAQNNPQKILTLMIVGGGAGGVELALNMQARLSHYLPPQNIIIHLIHKDKKLLSHHNPWVSQSLEKILIQRGINLHLSETVTQVISPSQLSCQSGLTLRGDHIFWVTQASPTPWIKTSGLTTDSQGFVLVEDTLQSVSHPNIFAAGDMATMKNYSRPKAGVFAVRQGKPLVNNLRRLILGQKLLPYRPQKRYLALIGTGDRQAIASWGNLGWASPLLWKWKDAIDRQFMARFP